MGPLDGELLLCMAHVLAEISSYWPGRTSGHAKLACQRLGPRAWKCDRRSLSLFAIQVLPGERGRANLERWNEQRRKVEQPVFS